MLVRASTLNAALAPLTAAVERLSGRLDGAEARANGAATETAVMRQRQEASDANMKAHLAECKDRWVELRKGLGKVLFGVMSLLIVIVGSLIGFIVVHFVIK